MLQANVSLRVDVKSYWFRFLQGHALYRFVFLFPFNVSLIYHSPSPLHRNSFHPLLTIVIAFYASFLCILSVSYLPLTSTYPRLEAYRLNE
jgi:hypothetical protein